MNVLESFRLDEKVALVTGGAGHHGRQIVESLAEAGAHTWMASRNAEKLKQHAERFQPAGLKVSVAELNHGGKASVLKASLLELRDPIFSETIN